MPVVKNYEFMPGGGKISACSGPIFKKSGSMVL